MGLGLEITKHFEGFRSNAYLCPAKVWTFGFGTTVIFGKTKVKKGDVCTIEEAEKYLAYDFEAFISKVDQFIKVPILENQRQALASFFYNCGTPTAFISQLNKGIPLNKIWGYFLMYSKIKADNDGIDNDKDGVIDEKGEMKELLGLIRRRNSEAHLYVLGTINFYENIK